jgi:pterin-4a-carbinolamine dehydratase
MPPPEALDSCLADLYKAQAERVRLDTWDSDLARLIESLSHLTTAVVRPNRAFPNGIRIARPHPRQKERRVLSSAELAERMQYLSNWREESNFHDWAVGGTAHELVRAYEFASFDRAMQFMNFAGKEIDQWQPQHHPRWENQWRSVKVWLTTWDVGCRITELDVKAAEKLDALHVRFDTNRA